MAGEKNVILIRQGYYKMVIRQGQLLEMTVMREKSSGDVIHTHTKNSVGIKLMMRAGVQHGGDIKKRGKKRTSRRRYERESRNERLAMITNLSIERVCRAKHVHEQRHDDEKK